MNDFNEASNTSSSKGSSTAGFGFGYELHSQILPGLWQGGTHDSDVIDAGYSGRRITKNEFDSVYTFYGAANAADYGVFESRFAFYDHDMTDFDVERDLLPLVVSAHADWRAGKRVLIRCQAGLNRSGLVMALVLMREGYSPEQAIDQIRSKRGASALCNRVFTEWLITEARSSYWQVGLAA